ncbi:MAG: hypothetical protein AB7T27_10115 [Kiritimatiellia bacterium]
MSTQPDAGNIRQFVATEVDRILTRRAKRIAIFLGIPSVLLILSALATLYGSIKNSATNAAVASAVKAVQVQAKQLEAIVDIGKEQLKDLTLESMTMSRDLGRRAYELDDMSRTASNTLTTFYVLKDTIDKMQADNATRVLESITVLARDPDVSNTLLEIASARDKVEGFDQNYIARFQQVQFSYQEMSSRVSVIEELVKSNAQKQ